MQRHLGDSVLGEGRGGEVRGGEGRAKKCWVSEVVHCYISKYQTIL